MRRQCQVRGAVARLCQRRGRPRRGHAAAARAADLRATCARGRHVHSTMLHNFRLGPTFQHWPMWSYINIAKPFVSHELRIAALG